MASSPEEHALLDRLGFFPPPELAGLLGAILLPEPAAMAALTRWRAAVDLDRLDPAAHRLLPHLWRTLAARRVADPDLERLKGVYKATLYRNRLLVHRARAVVAALARAGIPVMAVKGLAMILTALGGDYGLRPMQDVDLLVPPERIQDAVAVVAGLGYRKVQQDGLGPVLPDRHACNFEDAGGFGLDLHWYRFFWACHPAADRGVWERAGPADLAGVPLLVASPTDQVVSHLMNALTPSRATRAAWIPDLLAVLARDADRIDWAEVVAQAGRLRLQAVFEAGLAYLAREFDAPVPAATLAGLARRPWWRDDLRWMDYAGRPHPTSPELPWPAIFRHFGWEFWFRIGRWRAPWEWPGAFLDFLVPRLGRGSRAATRAYVFQLLWEGLGWG